MNTLWEIQSAIRKGTTCYGPDPGAPYSASEARNHLSAYENATRPATKRENAREHCDEMAIHCWHSGNIPEAIDWFISGISLQDNQTSWDISSFTRLFWPSGADASQKSWSEFQQAAKKELDSRLVGSSILRLLCLPGICQSGDKRIAIEQRSRLTTTFMEAMPDLCKDMRINQRLDQYNIETTLQVAYSRLFNHLAPIDTAINCQDISYFSAIYSEIQRAINNREVNPIIIPFLPKGFTKTRISPAFNLIEEFRRSSPAGLPRALDNCCSAMDDTIAELVGSGTFFSRRFLLPLFSTAKSLLRKSFESSEATKPALIDLLDYERKYPLRQVGAQTKLRFLLKNNGPGPASNVDIQLCFGSSVEPQEAARFLSSIDVNAYDIEFPATVKEAAETLDYIAVVTWSNYDGSEGRTEQIGSLCSQRPDIDWEGLASRHPYSLEAVTEGDERPFIGRATDLQGLYRQVITPNMGSAVVAGQKRVGKTSLVNELIRESTRREPNLAAIYLDGSYAEPTAIGTIRSLGDELCRKFRRPARQGEKLPTPEFKDSLSPFAGRFLEDLLDLESSRRFLIVMDEFDCLPVELYKRGDLGDSFFLGRVDKF